MAVTVERKGPAMGAVIEVGRFRFDRETQTLEGPADYMREQGNAKVDRIVRGDDVAFNMTCHLSPDIETAILIHLQTDYAGWHGMKSFQAMRERAR